VAENANRTEQLLERWRTRVDVTTVVAVLALAVSGLSFYRSYLYIKQELDVTVTEVSYMTNQGELYMTVAFSNSGNKDAALLRVEPTLWGRGPHPNPEWLALADKVDPLIPVTSPKTPMVVRAGGVEVVTLSAKLNAQDAEQARVVSQGAAFLGIRVATMNSDGNLYLLEHPVARLAIDREGKIHDAQPAINRTLSGFSDLQDAPPGDTLVANKKTPFVWADAHF